MEGSKSGTSSSIIQGGTSNVIKPKSQQQTNQTSSNIEIEENIENLTPQLQIIKNQPTIIKANLIFDKNYSENTKKMLKELIKNGHFDPLRILNNEGITTDSLTKIEREKNIKIIEKLDEILELSKFDVSKQRILILNLKSENKDDKSLKLVINLKNLYVQGFINNENQYFHFEEEKKNELEKKIENKKKELSDESEKLKKYDEIFIKIETYNTYLKNKNLTKDQKINTQKDLETAKQNMKELLKINNNNWKNEIQKIEKNMDILENDIYWNQEKINIIKINEEVVKKYNCKKISLNYTEKYSKEGLDLKLENSQYKSILISKNILFNQTILNLANHTANENIKIKPDLVSITFVTSEAMRFGSYIKYFDNYKDKNGELIEFKNILEDVQKVINNNETIDWKDYAPQLIGGWKTSSKQLNENRKELFFLVDVQIMYTELVNDFLKEENNFKVDLNNIHNLQEILEKIPTNEVHDDIKAQMQQNITVTNLPESLKETKNKISYDKEHETIIKSFEQIYEKLNIKNNWKQAEKNFQDRLERYLGEKYITGNKNVVLELIKNENVSYDKLQERKEKLQEPKEAKVKELVRKEINEAASYQKEKETILRYFKERTIKNFYEKLRLKIKSKLDNKNSENSFDFFPEVPKIEANKQNEYEQAKFLSSFITTGNKDLVELIISKKPEIINYQGDNDFTSLHHSVYQNNLEITNLLLDNGVDINKQDDYKCTPLHKTAERGDEEIIKLLLNKGANPNLLNKGGLTSLHLSCIYGCIELAEELLTNENSKNNIDVNLIVPTMIEGYYYAALHFAIKANNDDTENLENYEIIINKLLEHPKINVDKHAIGLCKNNDIKQNLIKKYEEQTNTTKKDDTKNYAQTFAGLKGRYQEQINNTQKTKKGGIKLASGKYVPPKSFYSFTTEKNKKQYGNKKDDDFDKGGAGTSGSSQQVSNNVIGSSKTATTTTTNQGQSTKQTTSNQHTTFENQLQNLTTKSQSINKKTEIKKPKLLFKQIHNEQLTKLQNLTISKKINETQIEEKTQISTPKPIEKEKISIETFVNNLDSNKTTKKVLQQGLVG